MVTAIDIDQLRRDVAPDQPCGGDLEYDPDFGALDRAATPIPEQVMGDAVIPAKEPDWADVRRRALDLFRRTQDLRIGVTLARALLNTDGLIGFRDALELLGRLVAERWNGVYPRLDPDDDLDPTARVNILASLCDPQTFLREIAEAPLIVSRTFGPIRYRDIAIASGELKPAAADEAAKAADLSQINAAFRDADAATLQAVAEAVHDALERAVSLETALTTQVGVRNAVDFAPLSSLLASIGKFLREKMTELGLAGDAVAEAAVADTNQPPPAALDVVLRGNGSRTEGTDEVTSREDVIRLLDRICAYYQRFEPASPVPLLLLRARRLVPMQFVDVIRDLAPDALPMIEMLRGGNTAGEGE